MRSNVLFALDNLRGGDTFADAVHEGLTRARKAIPCKYLYDEPGSVLFDRICDLPEYYPTRTETALLRRHADEIADLAGPACMVVEFGSGSSTKTRILLDHLDSPTTYVPIDVSCDHLRASAAALATQYPALGVYPLCADFMGLAALPAFPSAGTRRRLGFFPGSTIGNLMPDEARSFMAGAAALLGKGGGLLLGVDLKKDPALLHAAYNDSEGITAAFTLNLMARMNRELEANFDLAGFVHDARYNPVAGRIEIYLRSLQDQTATVAGRRIGFTAGERIHVEYSYKYDVEGIAALARDGGFTLEKTWVDDAGQFSVSYLTVA